MRLHLQAEAGSQGSNRTFMELKLVSASDLTEAQKVLIAPLWN